MYNLLKKFVTDQLRSGKTEGEVKTSLDALIDFIFENIKEECPEIEIGNTEEGFLEKKDIRSVLRLAG